MVSLFQYSQSFTETTSKSLAEMRWRSVSFADLMEVSRKRANSRLEDSPHPSAMLAAMLVALALASKAPRKLPQPNGQRMGALPRLDSLEVAHMRNVRQ